MSQEVIIIGGGISGLSLAHFSAKAGFKPIVLEKNDSVGGSFNSYPFSDNGNAFWLELGAHTCYNSYQNLLNIVEDCGLAGDMIPRAKVPFTLLKDNELKSVFSVLNLFEAMVSVPKLFSLKKDGLSVRDYYSQIVGKNNYNNVLTHFFNAVPSQPTDDFPADLMFKSREKRKDVLKNYTFKQGLQSVAMAIANNPEIKVHTNQDVVGIEKENGEYKVHTSTGDWISAPYLAIAVPSAIASGLLEKAEPDIAGHLGALQSASVDSVGVMVKKSDLNLKPVAAIISPNDSFYSAVSRDTVPDDTYRGFAFHFKPGTSQQDKHKRILEVLGISDDKILQKEEALNTVPSLRLGHKDWLGKINQMVEGKNLLLTGNYYGGMAIEDCTSRSYEECRRLETLAK